LSDSFHPSEDLSSGPIVCAISESVMRQAVSGMLDPEFGPRVIEAETIGRALELLVSVHSVDAIILDHPAGTEACLKLMRGLKSRVPVYLILNEPMTSTEALEGLEIAGRFEGTDALEDLVARLSADMKKKKAPAPAPRPKPRVPAAPPTPAAQELVKKLEAAANTITPTKPNDDFIRSAHEATMEIIRRTGLNETSQQLIRSNVMLIVKSMGTSPKLKNILRSIFIDRTKYRSSHSVVLAQLTCAIAGAVKWGSSTTFQKLTLASFLHDLEVEIDDLADVQTRAELEARANTLKLEEMKRYLLHPARASEMAQRMDEIPPDVDTIIVQHHERPDGTGFPRGLSASQFHPLSVVFVIGHDLLTAVHRSEGPISMSEFIASREQIYSMGNFRKVLRELDTIPAMDGSA